GDPTRAKSVIQAGGQLELKLVEDPVPYASQAEALSRHGGVMPAGTEIVPGRSETRNPSGGVDTAESWYVLSRLAVVTGRDLRSAVETRNTNNPGMWQVNFALSPEAARRFGPFTEQNKGRQMAIVLDHRVYSAPVINGRIDDSGLIEGNFSQESAHDLALVLRAGALPASIRYLEERTVGPSLGADSIRHGVQAAVIGMSAVLLFMLIYYRASGINANVGLILNLVILLGFLGFSGATLTLPGIAGVILTVGMGVDSNVLIFERIREELRAGKTAAAAVDQGFARAWITIVDTHITTIVSAFILFMFGTGPVRGFAVTLTFGLLANLFTAVFVSRVIFEAELKRAARGQALSI